KEKLKIVFDKPMDLYSILGGISINIYNKDINIRGKFIPGSDDKEWYFIPEKPWTEKKYTLIFNKYVSDPSGNGLIKPFETTKIKESYTKDIVKVINFRTN
ncbi:MAG: Ig-like domain-containing protein, partial [Chryseobacterium sp.]